MSIRDEATLTWLARPGILPARSVEALTRGQETLQAPRTEETQVRDDRIGAALAR